MNNKTKEMKVEFEFDKTVAYWNKDRGEGVKVGGEVDASRWGVGVDLDFVATIEDISDVQKELKSELKRYGLPTDYFSIYDGRVSFNTLEDGEGNVLGENDEEKMHNDGEQVYICDYNVFIEIQEVYEPTLEQLVQMFPNADY